MKCTKCGKFLNVIDRWNHLRCDAEITGAWIYGQKQFDSRDALNFCEILVHYRKML